MIAYLAAAALLQELIHEPGGFVRTINRSDGVAVCQTLEMRLTAPERPDVWLIGVAHIGSKAYYAEIQALLDAQDTVLYEGVRRDGASKAPPQVDRGGPKSIYQIISDAIGLDFQLVDIDYNHPGWINSDMTLAQLDALNKKLGRGAPTQFSMVEKMLDPRSPQTKMFGQLISAASPSMKQALSIFLIETVAKVDAFLAAATDPATINLLLTVRNKSVESMFDKVISGPNPPKSVAVFYGAAHMHSIQRVLAAKYGYRPSEQRWLTFAKADRRGLDVAGKQFLKMLELTAKGL